jgi:hypothetical protein
MLTRFILLAASAAATELLLPLYNHPGPDGAAWSSVQAALSSTPDLSATVIINVDSGPGDPFVTGEGRDWRRAGRALGDLPNTSLVGYVRCSRCQRPLDEVKRDVDSWASWREDQGVDVRGIFIDEAPNDGSCVSYLSELTRYIRRTADHFEAVVFNPGFPSTPMALEPYYALHPTHITALETCFATTSNGQDLCHGTYTVYDQGGYGTTIDDNLIEWVGKDNYESTAILIHGFHSSNGQFEANNETLLSALEAVTSRGIGAVAITTNHWVTPDAAPADIGTLVATLNAANKQ